MIRHVVLFKKKSAADEEVFLAELAKLGTLEMKLDGVDSWWLSLQRGMGHLWDAGLIVDFVDAQALEAYNSHPVHMAFATAITEISDVVVFDSDVR
jgi:hypothetical protein